MTGGPLTITDANVILGRVQPHLFPSIFGVTENLPLDVAASKAAFEALTLEINQSNSGVNSKQYTIDEVAAGFVRVANEAMARPIRNLTTMKGRDVTKHALSTFGGAGPQHCCALAKSLGIKKIYLSKYGGILSAFGLSLADVVIDRQEPCSSSVDRTGAATVYFLH
jgi:5-oxoprolinase (ATP-hydrolysing)